MRLQVPFPFCALILILEGFLYSTALAEKEPAKEIPCILILNSYHKGYQWADQLSDGITDQLYEDLGSDLELHYEYLDAKRYSDGPTGSYALQMKDIFAFRYSKHLPHIIILSDYDAFQFILLYQQELFPRVPIVFCGLEEMPDLTQSSLITGIVSRTDFRGNIDLILSVFPNTRRIALITDRTTTGEINRAELERLHGEYANRVELFFLDEGNGLLEEELLEKASRLREGDIMFYSDFYRDATGEVVDNKTLIPKLSEKSPVPLFYHADQFLGLGAFGGKMIGGYYHGRDAARLAVRILQGEPVHRIPVVKQTPHRFMFDYRQLIRFGVALDRLPPESIIINRPAGFYEQYRALIWLTAGFFILQTGIIILLVMNIRRRKRIEELLRQSEEKFSKVYQTTPEAIVITSAVDGAILDVNPAFEKTAGFSRGEILGRTTLDVNIWVVPAERNQLRKDIEEKGEILNREFHFRIKDGAIRIGIVSGRPLTIAKESCFMFLIHDITDQKTAENALRNSEANLRTIFETSPFAIVINRLSDGVYLRVNPAFERLTGYREAEALGKTSFELGLNRSREEFTQFTDLLRRERIITDATIRTFTRTGVERILLFSSAIIQYNGEEAILTITVDMTETKRMEEQLRQAQKLDALGQLAGGIAHDFNNMLTGIMGYAELLSLQIEEGSPLRASLAPIQKGAEQAAALIQKLLAFSRKKEMVTASMDIHEPIRSAIALLERTIDRRIQIVADLHASPSFVVGDPILLQNAFLNLAVNAGQIEQVLVNLAVNARDAMPNGGTLIFHTVNVDLDEAFCRKYPTLHKPGKFIRIDVRDTGVGIPQEQFDLIFEPFFTTKPEEQGTGLGLAAVYGIIKDHRGAVTVTSEIGKGTEFQIFLPMESGSPSDESKPPDRLIRGHGHILVVDDEDLVRNMAHALLTALGYSVSLAEDGEQAISLYTLEKEHISLVLLDMVMPKIGGRDVFLRLREINPDVKVLFTSGFQREMTVDELVEMGAAGFLQKPFHQTTLSQAVANALAHS